jgi:hypothetical protein
MTAWPLSMPLSWFTAHAAAHAHPALWIVSLCLALSMSPARAAIWGYVDGAGVAHFAPHRVDSRYQVVLPDPGQPRDAGRVAGKSSGRSSLMTWLDISPEAKALQPLLKEASRATGVDAELLKAVVAVESGYRRQLVSPAGAVGLMQITPEAAERYGHWGERPVEDVEEWLKIPRNNVMVGARMLADLMRRFNGIDAALAAWNAGEGRVRRAGNRLPDIAETRAHVQLVLELYWSLLQERQYGRAHDMNLVPQKVQQVASAPR